MNPPATARGELDNSRNAVAIVQDGLFLYANGPFIERLGYASREDLEPIPLLDLVTPDQRARAKAHLAAAREVGPASDSKPREHLTLLRADQSAFEADLISHHIRYEDEDVVQILLLSHDDFGAWNRLRRLPWRLYLSLALVGLLILVPSLLMPRLNINNVPKVFFPADHPSVQAYEQLRQNFPSDQVIFLLFEGVALFSEGFLRAYDDLVRRLEAHDGVDKVLALTRQDHISGTDEGFQVSPLFSVGTLAEGTESQRRDQALADRFLKGTLVAGDGSALALVVIPKSLDTSMQRMAMEDFVLETVRTAGLSGYLAAMAGMLPLDVAELRSSLRDNMIFIPTIVVIGLGLIWWLYRRWLAVLLTGLVIQVIVSSSVASYVLAGQPFTLISSIIPALLSALTTSALIHLFNGVHFAAQRGLTGGARIDYAVRAIRAPVLFNSLTTAAGLASLATSPIQPVAVFGLISAVGVLLIYGIVIYVLPELLRRWDHGDWPTTQGGLKFMDRLVGAVFHLGIRRPVPTLIVLTSLLVVGIPWLFQVRTESNLQEFFQPDHPIRRDTQHVQAKLTGTTPLDLVLRADTAGGLQTPAALRFMREFQTWAESQPEVSRTISAADLIEEMNWGFHGEEAAARTIPDDPNLIAQYLLVYDGKDLFDLVDRDFRVAHIQLSVNVHRSTEISALRDRIRGWLAQHPPVQIRWEISGAGSLFADIADLLVIGLTYSLWGSVALIYFLLALQWRSVAHASITMIPNVAPIFFIFVLMGMTGIALDMATVMIASVAVGIAVDDTIHLFHGFIERVRRGIKPVTALARVYRQSGRAVVTTTVVLSAQFFILVLSEFVPSKHFGLLTGAGLVVALLFDLLMLPALLMVFFSRRPARPASEGPPPPDATPRTSLPPMKSPRRSLPGAVAPHEGARRPVRQ